jgi:hypothetical protein
VFGNETCTDHNCCNYGHGVGCNDDTIRQCVCAQDNFCCTTVWDQTCVARVVKGCGNCDGFMPGPIANVPSAGQKCLSTPAPTPDSGNCCQVRRTEGGCSLPAYSDCVKAQDGTCGATWDQRCIDKIQTCPASVNRQLCAPLVTGQPTPAPTPAPPATCDPGTVGCPCDNGACRAGNGQCDASAQICVQQTCNAGDAGCDCG